MVSFADPEDVVLQDGNRKPVTAGANGRWFFSAQHKYNGTRRFDR